jgi:hypothetical protein
MSTSNPSDPRLLLPEWLRDGDLPASIETRAAQAPVESQVIIESAQIDVPSIAPTVPFSDRLSLDTRLDPGLLVSATDLPSWLGGLERISPTIEPQPVRSHPVLEEGVGTHSEGEPEPAEEFEPSQLQTVDVQVNGWVMIAGAVGLLVLIVAALTLYLS